MGSIKLILGSLVGGLVVWVAVSCGGRSSNQADAQPATCASWQVSTFGASYNVPQGIGQTVDVPAGWEPIGLSPFGFGSTSGVLVGMRRCAQ